MKNSDIKWPILPVNFAENCQFSSKMINKAENIMSTFKMTDFVENSRYFRAFFDPVRIFGKKYWF